MWPAPTWRSCPAQRRRGGRSVDTSPSPRIDLPSHRSPTHAGVPALARRSTLVARETAVGSPCGDGRIDTKSFHFVLFLVARRKLPSNQNHLASLSSSPPRQNVRAGAVEEPAVVRDPTAQPGKILHAFFSDDSVSTSRSWSARRGGSGCRLLEGERQVEPIAFTTGTARLPVSADRDP